MFAFDYLLGGGDNDKGCVIEVVETRLRRLVIYTLNGVAFDADWYLASYPDVRVAFEAGQIASARDHYLSCGYFEGRWPRPINVDAEWYIRAYPDVAAAIRDRRVQTAQEHFARDGFNEGRTPFPGWTLLSDVGDPALDRLLRSGLLR